jgi:amino acid adenylation domain-containing protein
MNDLQSRISALSPTKRALLERRLREKAQRQEAEPIQPRSSDASPPLSFGQQRFWFIDQWEPGNPAYNTAMAFRIDGSLDATVLDQTLTEIARRHATLRTTFAADGETPVQIIHPAGPVTARRIDFTALSNDQKDVETSRLIVEEGSRPTDLVRGPIWRASLVQLEPSTHLLLLTVHHIVFDGWSTGVLLQEFATLYAAFTEGHGSPLPELTIQYADFAVWQRRRLQGELLTEQLRYWREQLRDLPTLDFPTDHPRPPVQTFTGAVHEMHVPSNVVDALKSVSRREEATLFMTLLAAFQSLLHRYSGQHDIVVGTPIAGRTTVEVEALIGFFVNMLVVRTDASGDPTFRELLGRVKRVAFNAYAHQDIPFEKLVEELQPRRDPSRNPLFQVVFAFQNVPRPSPSFNHLELTRIKTDRASTRFDLEVHLQEVEDGLRGRFVYNTALFESRTIARVTQHFRTLLDAIVTNPDVRLSQIELLTNEERRQILVEWNRTGTDYPREASIVELFEARATATPEALAVAFGEERLTYRQLNERANRLAHHLIQLGVRPGVLVGICVERSLDMIVGFLGILKGGGAYVPLEPSYPRERLAFMLNDAKVPVLVTTENLLSKIPPHVARVVSLDPPQFERHAPDNPSSGVTATDLAYVLYTSGSTGQPKGVAVPHRAVVRLVVKSNYVQLQPSDRVAQVSNASFDAATFEIWGALLEGGALIGIPHAVLLSPQDFARTIEEKRISTLFLTTALFNQMASEVPTAFRQLRYLLFGGETCDPRWVRTILRSGSPQTLLHVYGPTENTTFTTWHSVDSVPETAATVPIGRPIANTRVYLLDAQLQPVPVGVIGELHIGGDGLAREYLNRPDLTAEKFIRDPFDAAPSARLYKTGDFARYQPDGSIDFVGRIDGQIKIRGFRIELSEIEAALAHHPDVGTSVVITKHRGGSDRSLVAYLVPSRGAQPSPDVLRRFLRAKLPDYMVPSTFVLLDSLPLTPNGKVDYAALPEPGHDTETRRAEPRTSIERSLVEIWEDLLGTRGVGISDNFFDLGGHSLLAIQLIARLEKRFGRTLPVSALFQAPTIEQLASILTDDRPEQSWSSLIPLQPEGSNAPFFWIHGDSSNALLSQYLGPDRPLYAVEHQGHDGKAALYTEVDTIAKHYVAQLRAVRPHGPYLLGGYSFGAVAAFEMAYQLRTEGEEVLLLFMLDPPGKMRESVPSVRDRAHKHLRELIRRGPRSKVEHVFRMIVARARERFNGRWAAIGKRVKRLRWERCLKTGGLLPPSLRSPYILDVYRIALCSYTPQPYSGRVTIFKAGEIGYRPPLNWQELMTGELQMYESAGGHMDLTREPYVAVWAAKLRDALDSVTAGTAGVCESGAAEP